MDYHYNSRDSLTAWRKCGRGSWVRACACDAAITLFSPVIGKTMRRPTDILRLPERKDQRKGTTEISTLRGGPGSRVQRTTAT